MGRYIPFTEDPISTTALYWKRKVMLGRQVGQSLERDLYYELRYESLIANPESESKKLCDFLKVPYEERMIRFYENRPDSEKGRNSNSWKPITPGLRDWRTQMEAVDLERFQAVAGDLLEGLGYGDERRIVEIMPNARDHAAQILNRFTNALHSVHKPLPEGWPFAG